MAELGFRTINEMVGQSQMLKMRDDIEHWKYKHIDLSAVLHKVEAGPEVGLYKQMQQDHGLELVLDHALIKTAKEALDNQIPVTGSFPVKNTDRTIGAMLSFHISSKYKGQGLPEDTIQFKFNGSAGQSWRLCRTGAYPGAGRRGQRLFWQGAFWWQAHHLPR